MRKPYRTHPGIHAASKRRAETSTRWVRNEAASWPARCRQQSCTMRNMRSALRRIPPKRASTTSLRVRAWCAAARATSHVLAAARRRRKKRRSLEASVLPLRMLPSLRRVDMQRNLRCFAEYETLDAAEQVESGCRVGCARYIFFEDAALHDTPPLHPRSHQRRCRDRRHPRRRPHCHRPDRRRCHRRSDCRDSACDAASPLHSN
jgi:hypothetical protein